MGRWRRGEREVGEKGEAGRRGEWRREGERWVCCSGHCPVVLSQSPDE